MRSPEKKRGTIYRPSSNRQIEGKKKKGPALLTKKGEKEEKADFALQRRGT